MDSSFIFTSCIDFYKPGVQYARLKNIAVSTMFLGAQKILPKEKSKLMNTKVLWMISSYVQHWMGKSVICSQPALSRYV